MFRFWQQLKNSAYFQRNKVVLVLLFCWLFRITVLLQRHEGVSLNKFVLLQIAIMLSLFFYLAKQRYYFPMLLQEKSTIGFSAIYFMGMASIAWSCMPLLSCYFAFENLVCMTAVWYLLSRCKDKYEIERLFVYSGIGILSLFFFRTLFLFHDFHSVSASSVAAMLAAYCLGEYGGRNRPPLNSKVLRWGGIVGLAFLVLTTSSGAIVAFTISMLALAMFGKNSTMKFLAFAGIMVLVGLWVSGSTETVLGILFPNKSMASITTGHGRATIWAMVNDKVALRPWFGWGYGAVERILPIYCTDVHNSFVGVRGALGNVGCVLFVIASLYQLYYFFSKRLFFGYRGLFIALICAFVNANTSNFLAAKAGEASLIFNFLLVMGAFYASAHASANFLEQDGLAK